MRLQTCAALALSMTLSACAIGDINNSQAFKDVTSQAQAQRMVPRGLSMAQVQERFGNPSFRQSFGGTSTWTYNREGFDIRGGNLTSIYRPNVQQVVITFGQSGRVTDVNYLESISS
ncbi:outer membrane protein assembly factor BamE [uncultured Litoreibacter sp.]|uniref:outer membrane protein assembly factor BamE domain-containing protein n=1 Tax=uncultured Litoreibacter sp. TaxID=1392394 RepID=UPI0026169E01|nr:outer membrane protein assembly factor BamE [uncultured Litoreibacter sp.]